MDTGYKENLDSARIIGRGDQHVRVEMRGKYDNSGERYIFLWFDVPCAEPYKATLKELALTRGFMEAFLGALRKRTPLSRAGYEEVVAHYDGARANYVVDALEDHLRQLDARHRATEDQQRIQRGTGLVRRENPELYRALWGEEAGAKGTGRDLQQEIEELERMYAPLFESADRIEAVVNKVILNLDKVIANLDRLRKE